MSAVRFAYRTVALLCSCTLIISAQNAVPIQYVHFVSPAEPRLIPQDYLGLSFETLSIEPRADGSYAYFRPTNVPLITLFQTLGVRSLRIGGNTSDHPGLPIPSQTDIDSLFAFAKSAGVKVIYTLRLRQSNPEKAMPLAKYIMSHYADSVSCLVIGNEPDEYEPSAQEDDQQILRYLQAMRDSGVSPIPKLCGPSTEPKDSAWASQFGDEVAPKADVLWVTQHSYPGGNGRKVLSPESGRNAMLDGSFVSSYQRLLDSFAPAIQKKGLKFRIEETNNYYFGGAKDVSNTFAAALWGLDYLYWWAEHGAQGVNFHTGDQVAAADEQTPCWYATFWSQPQGVQVMPLAYALAAFAHTAQGEILIPQRSQEDKDLSVHATRSVNGDMFVTLINRSHGGEAHSSNIVINPKSKFSAAEMMLMESRTGRIDSLDGVTLGASGIDTAGHWKGSWKALKLPKHEARVSVPPATAMILHLRQGKGGY